MTTLHIHGFAHTEISEEFNTCAHTQKIVKFLPMMHKLGYRMHVYGTAISPDLEQYIESFTSCLSREERIAWHGEWAPSQLPGFHAFSLDNMALTWYQRLLDATAERIQPGDIIAIFGGPVMTPKFEELFPDHLVVEAGVGYEQPIAKYRVFESHPWLHYCMGLQGQGDGLWNDDVIPNYFDPADFPLVEKKEDYLLFVGRLILRKGLLEAAAVAKAAGMKLKVAGPGHWSYIPGQRLMFQGADIQFTGDDIEYLGVLDIPTRAEVMGKAHALLAPTRYVEPFGGVTVEANMCGTPAITTDWGAFTETIIPGFNGGRIRSIKQGVDAVNDMYFPGDIRAHAERHYSLDAIGPRYHRYFERIQPS